MLIADLHDRLALLDDGRPGRRCAASDRRDACVDTSRAPERFLAPTDRLAGPAEHIGQTTRTFE